MTQRSVQSITEELFSAGLATIKTDRDADVNDLSLAIESLKNDISPDMKKLIEQHGQHLEDEPSRKIYWALFNVCIRDDVFDPLNEFSGPEREALLNNVYARLEEHLIPAPYDPLPQATEKPADFIVRSLDHAAHHGQHFSEDDVKKMLKLFLEHGWDNHDYASVSAKDIGLRQHEAAAFTALQQSLGALEQHGIDIDAASTVAEALSIIDQTPISDIKPLTINSVLRARKAGIVLQM
ncbi:MAG: hypothetical protein ACOYK8_10280 [Alphaproteobacteria bacterium]